MGLRVLHVAMETTEHDLSGNIHLRAKLKQIVNTVLFEGNNKKTTLHGVYLLDKLSLSVLHFIYLHDSGSSGKAAQTDKLRAAWNPFTLKNGVVQTLLNVRNNLRL